MDFASFIGIITGIGLIISAIFMGSSDFTIFINVPGIMIVIGGTIAATLLTIVKEERDHVWVTGLADKETIITVGQGFVDDGESVSADFDS